MNPAHQRVFSFHLVTDFSWHDCCFIVMTCVLSVFYYYCICSVLFHKAPRPRFGCGKVLYKSNLIDRLIIKRTYYVSPNSAKAAGLRQSAGWGSSCIQLPAGNGDFGRHGAHHPGHSANLSGFTASQGRGTQRIGAKRKKKTFSATC